MPLLTDPAYRAAVAAGAQAQGRPDAAGVSIDGAPWNWSSRSQGLLAIAVLMASSAAIGPS